MSETREKYQRLVDEINDTAPMKVSVMELKIGQLEAELALLRGENLNLLKSVSQLSAMVMTSARTISQLRGEAWDEEENNDDE